MITLGLVLLLLSVAFKLVQTVCEHIERNGVPEVRPRQEVNVNVDKVLVVNQGERR